LFVPNRTAQIPVRRGLSESLASFTTSRRVLEANLGLLRRKLNGWRID
jgi:hypothetical protein